MNCFWSIVNEPQSGNKESTHPYTLVWISPSQMLQMVDDWSFFLLIFFTWPNVTQQQCRRNDQINQHAVGSTLQNVPNLHQRQSLDELGQCFDTLSHSLTDLTSRLSSDVFDIILL